MPAHLKNFPFLRNKFVVIAGSLISVTGNQGQRGNFMTADIARDTHKPSKSYAF
jgi:hypothetical protein